MDELRRACAEVTRRARSVQIDDDVLAAYAVSLPDALPALDELEDETLSSFPVADERALFWLSLDAINFGSGWFPTLRKPAGRSGYATISSAWRRHAELEGPMDAHRLSRISAGELAEILGQERDHKLMGLFARSLNDLGARLAAGHDSSAGTLIREAGGSAVRFAERLGGWPCFADCSHYEELSVPFLKRAQIAAADLRRAGVAQWVDERRLTMFADNLVPHVLRLDGVLRFEPGLVARIDAGELLAHGSRDEVEIRACAVEAVERIVAARAGRPSAAEVDQLLWQRGQGPRYKAFARHRSRGTAY